MVSNVNKIEIKWQKCLKKVSFLYEKKTLSFAVAKYLWDFGDQSFHEKLTYSVTLWHVSRSRVPLEKLILEQQVKTFQHFMKLRRSLLHSQEPTTGLQCTLDQSIPQPHSLSPRVGSDFLCNQVILRRFYFQAKTLNTIPVFLHILHVVPNSYLL
jgi:hypothetical protein